MADGYSVNKLLDDSGAETGELVVTYYASPEDGVYASLREIVEPSDARYAELLTEVSG